MLQTGAQSEDLDTAKLHVEKAKASLRQAENSALLVIAKQRETQASIEFIQQKRSDLTAAQIAAGCARL